MVDLIRSEIKVSKPAPELKLWRAVLAQLFDDAFSNTYNGKNQYDKRDAREYLQHLHRDYATICTNAGFDPKYVHKKVQQYFLIEKIRG